MAPSRDQTAAHLVIAAAELGQGAQGQGPQSPAPPQAHAGRAGSIARLLAGVLWAAKTTSSNAQRYQWSAAKPSGL